MSVPQQLWRHHSVFWRCPLSLHPGAHLSQSVRWIMSARYSVHRISAWHRYKLSNGKVQSKHNCVRAACRLKLQERTGSAGDAIESNSSLFSLQVLC
jgi:hypothetical protein